jgi:phage FluMu protein Com
MPIEFPCPGCQNLVRTPDSAAGKKGKCPECGTIVQIPSALAPGPVPAAPIAKPVSRPAATPANPRKAAAPPEAIEFFCTFCGGLVRTPAATAGKKGKCPHCQAVVQIPAGLKRQEPGATGQGTGGGRGTEEVLPTLVPIPAGLTPLPPLTPLGGGPGAGGLTPLGSDPLPGLAPLAEDLFATLPPPNPYAAPIPGAISAGRYVPPAPKKPTISDFDRRGLPWERDPSLEALIETARMVLYTPGEAFTTMRRRGGAANALGFLIVTSVLANVGVVIEVTLIIFAMVLATAVGLDVPVHIRWQPLLVAGCLCAALSVFVALATATVSGLVWAILFHIALLACGAAHAGFEATYRVVAFTFGAVQLVALTLLGIPFIPILLPIILFLGFSEAHETSGGKALIATVAPLLLMLCCLSPALLTVLPILMHAIHLTGP